MELIKIFIVGPYHSGKTTFIRQLDPTARSMERLLEDGSTTTIGLDFGAVYWVNCPSIQLEKLVSPTVYEKNKEMLGSCTTRKVILIGSPGQSRFSKLRRALSVGSHGILLVADGSNFNKLSLKRLLNELKGYFDNSIPMVAIVNKQDLPNVLRAKDVTELIPEFRSIPVLETSALKGIGVVEAMLTLLRMVEAAGIHKISETEEKKTQEKVILEFSRDWV